jgi:pyridoxal/pyridoxine/pyridoxamine kinase
MAKYAELAKQIFQTSTASVSILMGEEEIVWGSTVRCKTKSHLCVHSSQPCASPDRYTSEQAVCSHAVLHEFPRCTVVADFSKDWRFQNNPAVKQSPQKVSGAGDDESASLIGSFTLQHRCDIAGII